MFKYLKILRHLLLNNLVRSMEYRLSFFLSVVYNALWAVVQIALVSLFFVSTNSIHGWTLYELYLLVGMYRCLDGLFHIFFYKNLLDFPENIRSGNFDFYLTKPINSLFLMSARYHLPEEVGTVGVGLAIVFYSLDKLHLVLTLPLLLTLAVTIFCGIVALYSIILFFSSFSFFLTRLTALESIWDMLSKTLRVPTDLITQGNNLANAFLLPLLIVVTLPSQILTQKISTLFFLLEIPSVFILFVISLSFFNFSLRRYSSASS